MKRRLRILVCCALAGSLAGCGGDELREDLPKGEPAEVQYVQSLKADIQELHGAFSEGGLSGLRLSIRAVAEKLQYWEQAPLTEANKPKVKALAEGVNELQAMLEGSPGRSEVQKKLQELSTQVSALSEEPAE